MSIRPSDIRDSGSGAAAQDRSGLRRRRAARGLPLPMLAAAMLAAVAGCKTVSPADPTRNPAASEGTRNEREAEAAVRHALQCYASWDLDGAYQLICSRDRAKLSLADFKKGSEKNREQLIQAAQKSEIVQSGESILPDGTPYVTVVVRVGPGEVLPYSVIREAEGWRLILVDPRRARQAGP